MTRVRCQRPNWFGDNKDGKDFGTNPPLFSWSRLLRERGGGAMCVYRQEVLGDLPRVGFKNVYSLICRSCPSVKRATDVSTGPCLVLTFDPGGQRCSSSKIIFRHIYFVLLIHRGPSRWKQRHSWSCTLPQVRPSWADTNLEVKRRPGRTLESTGACER